MSKKRLVRQIDLHPPTGTAAGGGSLVFAPVPAPPQPTTPPQPTVDAPLHGLLDAGGSWIIPDAQRFVRLYGGAGLDITRDLDGGVAFTLNREVPRAAHTGTLLLGPGGALVQDVPASANFLQVDGDSFAVGDTLVLRSATALEYLLITSGPTTIASSTTYYEYGVTRGTGGTFAQDWRAGDTVLSVGTTGDHFLEISGQQTWENIDGDRFTGPSLTINRMMAQGARNWLPTLLAGNLQGQYGYDSLAPAWGFAAGVYGYEPWLILEPTMGLRLGAGLQTSFSIEPDGDIKQYSGGVQRTLIAADGSGWLAGSDKIFWDTAGNLTVAGKLVTGVGSSIHGSYITADTITADKLAVATLSAITADMGSLTAGQIVIGTSNKLWLNDTSDGQLAIGGTDKAVAPFRVTATGALTATNATISGAITATSGAITGSLSIGASAPYIVLDGANKRVRSSNFAAGSTGFNLDGATGDAEFNNIVARGELATTVLRKSAVTAFAGSQVITKSASVLYEAFTTP